MGFLKSSSWVIFYALRIMTVQLLFFTVLSYIYCRCQGMTIQRIDSSRSNIKYLPNSILLLAVSTSVLLVLPKVSLAIPLTPQVTSIDNSSISNLKEGDKDESLVNGLISGAATRVAKELILHPIDTIKARMQQAPDNGNKDGLFDNLYDGLLPALAGGIPAGAAFFSVKDYSKKKLRKMGMGKFESTVLSVTAANTLYWIVRTPSEVIKTRMQINFDNSSSNTGEMIRKMVEDEGDETLTASVFGVKEGGKIEGLQAASTGAVAGLIAQVLTTPLDVARTRIMTKSETRERIDENSNPFVEMKNIIEDESSLKLFSGLLPRATRALASGAIQFATYELTQNALKR